MKSTPAFVVAAILCTCAVALFTLTARSMAPVPDAQRTVVRSAAAQEVSPTLGGLPLVDVWGGSARAVAGEGSIGFVAGWRYIETVDVAADPPRTLGRLFVDEPISAIAVRAGRLYVASERTLILFDIRRPARPSEIGRFELPPPAPDFRRRWIVSITPGDGAIWLDVAQQAAELPVHELVAVDESTPSQLRRVAGVPIDRPREVSGMWRVGARLIVATVTTGGGIPFVTHVGALDVRDPAAARWVGEAGPFNAYGGAAMRGEHLFLAVGRSPQLPERSPDPTTGIRVLDVAAAGGPTLVGRLDMQADMFGVDIVGTTAFVGVSDPRSTPPYVCAVAVFDVRTAQPIERLRRACGEMPPVGTTSHAFGDRWLTTVGTSAGFFGRSEPARWEAWSATGDVPRLLGRGDVAHAAVAAAADGGRLLLFDGDAARLLEPATDRWHARTVGADLGFGFPYLDSNSRAISLSGRTAIVAGSAGLVVFDVSSMPARRLSDLPWTALGAEFLWCKSVAVIGDRVVLAFGESGFGFTLVDLADAAHPTRMTTPWDGLEVTDLAVDGDRLYVVARAHLYIFVPGGPHGVQLAGEWIAEGWQSDDLHVAAQGDRAALGGGGFLQILDVRDPAAVRVVAERHEDDIFKLAFIGEDIVARAQHADRGVFDIGLLFVRGDDASEIAWRPHLGIDEDVAVIGERLYVASEDEGVTPVPALAIAGRVAGGGSDCVAVGGAVMA